MTQGIEIEKSMTPEQNLKSRLHFVVSRFITGELPILPTHDVAEPGETVADIEFDQVIYSGERNVFFHEIVGNMIKETLGVDVMGDPSFTLHGEDIDFKVFEFAGRDTRLYLLVREIPAERLGEWNETDILFYESSLLEMFEESQQLTRDDTDR